MSQRLKGMFKEKNNRWKGNEASYDCKHIWLRVHYGKAFKCENPICQRNNVKRFHWSNNSSLYKREREDYEMLCPSCHYVKDSNEIKKPLTTLTVHELNHLFHAF